MPSFQTARMRVTLIAGSYRQNKDKFAANFTARLKLVEYVPSDLL